MSKAIVPFSVRVRCEILKVYPEEFLGGGGTVVFRPFGSGAVFQALAPCFRQEMLHDVGKCVRAELDALYSSLEFSQHRTMQVTDLERKKPTQATASQAFWAAGRYIGTDGESAIIQSEFLVLAEQNTNCQPQLGDWVEAQGEWAIGWREYDIIAK